MSNKSFPVRLLEDLVDSNARFDTILHLPTIFLSTRLKGYEQFLEEVIEKQNGASLSVQLPAFESILKDILNDGRRDFAYSHACEIMKVRGDFEFLVKVKFFIPTNFTFNENGIFMSASLNGSLSTWIFATDMQHAAVQAIEINNQFFNEAMQKAKVEQGFANAE